MNRVSGRAKRPTSKAHPPEPANRAERKAATQREILAVAKVHFERDGFDATNIRAIAKEAGVAPGTVLLHFHDKRDLLHAALYDDLEASIARALSTLPEGTLTDRLGHLTRSMFAYYEERPELSRTLLKESLLATGAWAAKFAGQVAAVHAKIAELAEQAKARGELARDADTPRLSVAWFSFYYFALIAWIQGAHPDPIGLVSRLTDQHLRGMRP